MTRTPAALPLLGLAVSHWKACTTTERPPDTVQIRDSTGILQKYDLIKPRGTDGGEP
jgi:hypothetical protein